MALVDPWGAQNQAQDRLNQNIDSFLTSQRQNRLDQRQATRDDVALASARQQLALGAVQLDEAQRRQQAREAARNAYSSNLDTISTTTLPGSDVGPPVTLLNPAYTDRQTQAARKLLGQDINSATLGGTILGGGSAIQLLQGMPQGEAPQLSAAQKLMQGYQQGQPSAQQQLTQDLGQARSNAAQSPAMAQLLGLNNRIGGMEGKLNLMTPPATPDAAPEVPQYITDPMQPVAVETKTPATHDQHLEAMARTYEEHGFPDEAAKIRDGISKAINLDTILATQKAQINAGGGDLQAYYTNKTKMADLKEIIADVSNLKLPVSMRQAALDFFKKNNPGMMDNATINDFGMDGSNGVYNKVDPTTGQVIGRMIFNPTKGELEFHANTSADTAHNVQEVTAPDGKTAKKFQFNPATQRYDIPMGPAYPVKSQVINVNNRGGSNGTQGTDAQVSAWSNKVATGQVTLQDIPARGGIRTQVIADLAQNYPNVDLAKVKAGIKWLQSPGAQQTLSLIDATKGIMADMRTAYAKLGKTDSPLVNYVQDKYQTYTGNADRSQYISLKNYGIQEVEKMLSGSGAMSDHRIKLAFDNLKETNTPEQFKRAMDGIETVLQERERATRQGPYPGATATAPGAAPGGSPAPAPSTAPAKSGISSFWK